MDLSLLFTSTYTMMIEIYVTMYLEIQKIFKFIGLVGPMDKRGCFSTFTVHLGLVGMGVDLPSCSDPFG